MPVFNFLKTQFPLRLAILAGVALILSGCNGGGGSTIGSTGIQVVLSECGQTLTAEVTDTTTETYSVLLNDDLVCPGGTPAVTLVSNQSSNGNRSTFLLDCQGHSLTAVGGGSAVGVLSQGAGNVHIRNCGFVDHDIAVRAVGPTSNAGLTANNQNIEFFNNNFSPTVLSVRTENEVFIENLTGNSFRKSGIVVLDGTTIAATCNPNSIDGLGNHYESDVPASEIKFASCDDLNGNNIHDNLDSNTVFDDLMRRYGGRWLSNRAWQKSEWTNQLKEVTNATFQTVAELNSNCRLGSCSKNGAWELQLIGKHNAFTGSGTNPSIAIPFAAWSDTQAPALLWSDVAPNPFPGMNIDLLAAATADGFHFGQVVRGTDAGDRQDFKLPAGSGVDARTQMNSVLYRLTGTGSRAFCDGVEMNDLTVVNCSTIEIENGPRLEFFAGSQARPYRNAPLESLGEDQGGFDDRKTGITNISKNPVACALSGADLDSNGKLDDCTGTGAAGSGHTSGHHNADISVEGPHQFEKHDNSDTLAYLDAGDFVLDHARVEVTYSTTINPPGVMLTFSPLLPSLPTANEPRLGGRPPKVMFAMAASLPSSAVGADGIDEYLVDGKDVTTLTGINFTSYGQADTETKSSRLTVSNSMFNTVGFRTSHNTRYVNQLESTELVQYILGSADWGSGAVMKIGGPLTFTNNKVRNGCDETSTISADRKNLLGNLNNAILLNFNCYSTGYGVIYADTDGQSATTGELTGGTNGAVHIANNDFKNVSAGIAVYGAEATIRNNVIRLVDSLGKLIEEIRTDGLASDIYGQDYPDDYPDLESDALLPRALPNPGLGSIRQRAAGVGIAAACGRNNVTYDGRQGTVAVVTSEEDSHGNKIDLYDEHLDHQNCQAIQIEGNTLYGNHGVGIALGGEWIGSESPCTVDATLPECFKFTGLTSAGMNWNVLVNGNTMLASGEAPIDEVNDFGIGSNLPHHTPGSPLLTPADGFDTCIAVAGPGIENLEGLTKRLKPALESCASDEVWIGKACYKTETLSQTSSREKSCTIVAGFKYCVPKTYSVTAVKNLPRVYLKSNTCGSTTIGSGGIAAKGSLSFLARNNIVRNAQYAALAGAASIRNTIQRTISNNGLDNGGRYYDMGLLAVDNTLQGGTLANTCSQKQIAESKVGAEDGVLCNAISADVYIALDSSSAIPGTEYVVSGNTLEGSGTVALDVSGVDLNEAPEFFDAVTVNVADNSTAEGQPIDIEVANTASSPALEAAIEAITSAAAIDTDGDGLDDNEDACPETYGPAERQGCAVADRSTVVLHIIDQAKSGKCQNGAGSCQTPLEGTSVRVYDRNKLNGLNITLLDGSQEALTKNPDSDLYDDIYESDDTDVAYAARFGCLTDASGTCLAGEETVGDYLVIVKYNDTETSKTVYTGKPKGVADFTDTNGDGFGDLAEKDFQIIKVYKKDGTVQITGGEKTVVIGSILEILYPDLAVWESGVSSYLYPFIFTSDSDWEVDACAQIPQGYQIVGAYDMDGNLLTTDSCLQTFVQNETKIIAFDIVDLLSPPPHLKVELKVKGLEHGQQKKLDLDIHGLRKGKDKKASQGL